MLGEALLRGRDDELERDGAVGPRVRVEDLADVRTHELPLGEVHRPAPPDDELLMACRRIAEAMDLFDEAACRRLAIGRSDLRALNLLEHGPLNAGEIARRLGLSKASVTSLVDRLVRAGYVRRSADGADRRGVLVELEPATWQAFAQAYRPLGLRVAAAVSGPGPTQRHRVAASLEQMGAAFDEARSALEIPS